MSSEPTDIDAEDLFRRIQMSMMLAEEEDDDQGKKDKGDADGADHERQNSNENLKSIESDNKPEISLS